MLVSIWTYFRTTWWFARRPSLYPQFIHLIRRKFSPAIRRASATHQASEAWCRENQVDLGECLSRLTGSSTVPSVRELFPHYYRAAEAQVAATPAEMGGEGATDLLFGLCEHRGAMRVLETGVAYGWSSLAILCSLQGREEARLESVDMPYIGKEWDAYAGCAVPEQLRTGWRIWHLADRQGLPRALKSLGPIDLCHYDSDKSYDGRMWAYPRLWGALTKGGFFVSDDINDDSAFLEFATEVGVEPVVVAWQSKFVGILVKP